MIEYSEIRDVHLELSSFCNARCPMCPRNFKGYPYNDGYHENNLTLDQIKIIFNIDFLRQIDTVFINGNFGDFVMNPESLEIIEYLSTNNKLKITISTNGSARTTAFWKSLAKFNNVVVWFCLDGKNQETHGLYRVDTNWNTVIKNATSFIDAGGQAVWKMIVFDHNRHEIEECNALSVKLGFKQFSTITNTRHATPVFDRQGNLTHTIGQYTGEKNFKNLLHKKRTDMVLVEDVTNTRLPQTQLKCETKIKKSIYISSEGNVYPCCYTGFNPKSYGHGEYLQAVNSQLSPLLDKNNALLYPLNECITWFSNIERQWDKRTYKEGRLIVCDDNCGKC